MIVTVKEAFVDEPKGRDPRKYNYGDVVDISSSDYERINSQQPTYLLKGRHNLGAGTCEPCKGKKALQEKRANTTKNNSNNKK